MRIYYKLLGYETEGALLSAFLATLNETQ